MYQPRDERGLPWTAAQHLDRYGSTARGHHEMANAFLTRVRSGGTRGMPMSFPDWVSRRGLGLEAQIRLSRRGWWGRPRVPMRCTWPVGPCAPGCTARHIDGDALDAAQVAA